LTSNLQVIQQVVEQATAQRQQQTSGPLYVFSAHLPLPQTSVPILETFIADLKHLVGSDDLVAMGVVVPPMYQHRVRRQTVDTSASDPVIGDIGLGKDYSDMYPAIFNIILWLMIVIGVAFASVAYCIWFMDPGKDSVIYRMTANRMKKDI